jgi:hypothetical protein
VVLAVGQQVADQAGHVEMQVAQGFAFVRQTPTLFAAIV